MNKPKRLSIVRKLRPLPATFLILGVFIVLIEACAAGILKFAPRLLPRPHWHVARENVAYYKSQEWGEAFWREHWTVVGRKMRYEPYVAWRSAAFTGEYINIDELGRRVTPGALCTQESYEIFVFGGSGSWGWGSPDWATMPARLQHHLSRSRDDVCVLNLSENAFVSTQGLIELTRQIQQGNLPDLVLFYDGYNDTSATFDNGAAGYHQRLAQIRDRLEGRGFPLARGLIEWSTNTHTFAFLRRLSYALPVPEPTPPDSADAGSADTVAVRTVATMLANYDIVRTLAARYGFKYEFFIQPILHFDRLSSQAATHVPMPPSSMARDLGAVYARLKASDGVDHLHYLGDMFNDGPAPVWLDDVHLTPEGNDLVALRIVEIIHGHQDQPDPVIGPGIR